MKTNIFLCVTEYHVLLSILMASEVYGSNGFENHIILCNGGRFNDMSRYDTTPRGNIIFKKYDKDYVASALFIDSVYNNCTGELFLFNLNYKHFIYLAYKLKQKGILTSFVQEGLASYIKQKYSTHKVLSEIRSSLRLFRELGIKDLAFYRLCYGFKGKFGRILLYYKYIVENAVIHKLWLTAPDGAKNGKCKIKQIPLFTDKSLKFATSFFKYNNKSLKLKKNDMLFVDQNVEGTKHFIEELSKAYPHSDIYIKLHPSSPESLSSEYERINNVKIINSLKGIPIDLLIQELKDAIIITPYSSALLIENPMCHYFYVYPWFIANGYGARITVSIYNPTFFIKDIKNVSEIDLFEV